MLKQKKINKRKFTGLLLNQKNCYNTNKCILLSNIGNDLLFEICFFLLGKDVHILFNISKQVLILKSKFLDLFCKHNQIFLLCLIKQTYTTMHYFVKPINPWIKFCIDNIVITEREKSSSSSSSFLRLNFGSQITTRPIWIKNQYAFYYEPNKTFYNIYHNILYSGTKTIVNEQKKTAAPNPFEMYIIHWKRVKSFHSLSILEHYSVFFPIRIYKNLLFLFNFKIHPRLEMIIWDFLESKLILHSFSYCSNDDYQSIIWNVEVDPNNKLIYVSFSSLHISIYSYTNGNFVYIKKFSLINLLHIYYSQYFTFHLSYDSKILYLYICFPQSKHILIFSYFITNKLKFCPLLQNRILGIKSIILLDTLHSFYLINPQNSIQIFKKKFHSKTEIPNLFLD